MKKNLNNILHGYWENTPKDFKDALDYIGALENKIARQQKELNRQKKQHQQELLLVLLGFIIIELLTIFVMRW